jgi:glutathione peroxidase-family protein
MLITKELEIKLTSNNGKTIKHLEEKGYIFNKKLNKNGNFTIEGEVLLRVKTEDLPRNVHYEVEYSCDYCEEEGKLTVITNKYSRYTSNRDSCVVKKDACSKCKQKKLKEANLLKYGVENVSQLDEVKKKKEDTCNEHFGVPCNLTIDETKEKIKQTCIEKYGVDNPSKNKDVKEKAKQTNLERWGTEWTSQSDNMKQKSKLTLLKRYGIEHNSHSKIFRDKAKNTMNERYGVDYASQNPEIADKIKKSLQDKYGVTNISQIQSVKIKKAETFFKNGTIATSNQQRFLHELLGGELNYSNQTPSLDIAFPNERVYIEFNGSGHALCVKMGQMTQQEFDNKERRRYYYLKNQGWKAIIINSQRDYLPEDDIILREIEKAKEWFATEEIGNNHYVINIGNKINDEIYGKLRKIKVKDLKQVV